MFSFNFNDSNLKFINFKFETNNILEKAVMRNKVL